MEIIPEGKHFRLVQETELPEILDYLERYLPESIKFHQTIKTYLNDRVWQFYFYVSKNWPDEPICLHFPGCTLTPNNNIYESIGIFCPSSKIECVDLLATETVLLNWKKTMYLNFTHMNIMNRLDQFYSKKFGLMERLDGDIYVFNKTNEVMKLDGLPLDAELRPLDVDNVKAIHDLYPASEIECVEVFEKLVQVLPGVGIFKKDTDELAAWMVHSYYGAMFSMQTRPEFRRKGYGIHLAKTLTEMVIERGYKPFVVIRPENDASRSLYKKLGFEKAFETCRVKLNPKDDSDNTEINIKNGNSHLQEVVDEGIEDMLADKLVINNENLLKDTADEGIED